MPCSQVDRAQQGFHAVGQDAGLVGAAGVLLAAAQQQVGTRARRRSGCAPTSASAWVLTMLARSLARSPSERSGWRWIELVGDGQPQHRIAEELQPLVGRQPAVLVGVAAVRQRQGEQLVGQLDTERLEQRCRDASPLTSRAVLRPASAGSMSASLAHRGSICSWWWPGSASASGTPHSGHSPGQSGRHTGENGSASPTASMIGCSRSMVSSDDVADLVGLGGRLGGAVGVGEQLGQVDLDVAR